jgi:outer membrane protein assembly factor BamA
VHGPIARILGVVVVSWALVWPAGLSAQQDGLRPKIGGLPFGAGINGGLEYRKTRLAGSLLDFRALALGSIKEYEYLEVDLAAPRLWNEHLFVELKTRYRNYPQEDFWGLGPNSKKSDRTDFRLEDFGYSGAFGVRPWKWLRIGMSGGLVDMNTGPGTDDELPSIEERFTPAETPALDHQPDYSHFGPFVEVDYQDNPGDPRTGGYYQFHWIHYGDRDFGRFSFRRYYLDIRQFFPGFEKRGTIAMRGLTSLSGTSPGQQVPFFMQPTAGGGDTIRGFQQYRFRDRNALLFNVEYRWRAYSLLELVAFGDTGKVFAERRHFGLDDLESSGGIGARVMFRGRVLIGLDLGISREGVQIWVRGSQTF